MKKILVVSTLFLSALMISCNKNQKAVKELEGNWEEVTIDGTNVPEADRGTINFDYCKLKKDEWCQMTYTNSDGYSAGSNNYKVIEKGEVLVQMIQDSTKGSIELQANIIELTKTDLKLELSYFGFVTTTTYQKK